MITEKEIKRKQRFLDIVGNEILCPLLQLEIDLNYFSDYILEDDLNVAKLKVIEAYDIIHSVKMRIENELS